MRGKVLFDTKIIVLIRITPAYAGKSGPKIQGLSTRTDHPRLCGEKKKKSWEFARNLGSPPPMRGKVGNR